MKTGRFCLRTIGISKKELKNILKNFEGIRYNPVIFGIDLYFKQRNERKKAKVLLEPYVYSFRDSIETLVGRMLKSKKLSLAIAESCTGGMLGSLITGVPGSSEYFLGGVIAYDNAIKEKILGVDEKTLINYGAVSIACANQMARGIRKLFGSDVGIGITGIAGPEGGKEKKPIGLVYIAIAAKDFSYVERFQFTGDREKVRIKASNYALNILRIYLSGGFL